MQKSLNDITPEDLQLVNTLAGLFFSPEEIAIMLEIIKDDIIQAMEDESSGIYRSFHTGRLQGEVDLRTGIMKMARAGSSPAQTMALDILNKSKLKLLGL